jgi:starch phosphorylase
MQHYFSSEFLMGAPWKQPGQPWPLRLGQSSGAGHGRDLTEILEAEPDANLGNGGLGRLAACFLDSCASLNLPVQGYGILYRYGLFKQIFRDGFQVEKPDPWMEEGYPFLIRREEETCTVRFRDMTVLAVPYDMPITALRDVNVNTLRLWKAESPDPFNYDLFNAQQFSAASWNAKRRPTFPGSSTRTTAPGRQAAPAAPAVFFVSASLQGIVANHAAQHGSDFSSFADFNCVQLNDTHPVLAVPELLRLLLDEQHLSWDDPGAVVRCFAYTNHTTLAEALETWDLDLLDEIFPRILELIREVDRRLRLELFERHMADRTGALALITGNRVHMARIACRAAYSINGVAAMHTEIIKKDTLSDGMRSGRRSSTIRPTG